MFLILKLSSLTALLNLLFFTSATDVDIPEVLHRSKRQLIYPNSTLLQFNVGFGFPSSVKSVNINYAFQANFQLPWNRTQIPIDLLHANSGYTGTARMKREVGIKRDGGDYQDDAKLYHFYKHVEEVISGHGYNGHACVLHTLCQLGAEPLHTDDEEDLLHEMASFVLNPTNDASHQVTEAEETYPYITAFKNGQSLQDCSKLYSGCSMSLVDMFTKLHGIV
ncbi:uncharacterized protein LOC142978962 [Anticarsia gemmatalis]|uniref:uncharacterized protein LOC142978962 n=1 Tax=Anticarsia gemmatalis TaxID=129554 RepID=UPI003F776E1D